MKRHVIAATGFISSTLLAACGLLPTQSPGDESYRQAYDSCLARSSVERERTQDLLGRDSGVADRKDPLSAESVAESKANAELSRCLQSKGHR
jgi:hypothetical protein